MRLQKRCQGRVGHNGGPRRSLRMLLGSQVVRLLRRLSLLRVLRLLRLQVRRKRLAGWLLACWIACPRVRRQQAHVCMLRSLHGRWRRHPKWPTQAWVLGWLQVLLRAQMQWWLIRQALLLRLLLLLLLLLVVLMVLLLQQQLRLRSWHAWQWLSWKLRLLHRLQRMPLLSMLLAVLRPTCMLLLVLLHRRRGPGCTLWEAAPQAAASGAATGGTVPSTARLAGPDAATSTK